MKPSILRLVVTSVVGCVLIVTLVAVLYVRTKSWTADRAREDGVFLVHEMLASLPEEARRDELRRLQQHFETPFGLKTRTELETEHPGVDIRPYTREPLVVARGEEYYLLPFEDSDRLLVAGPVHPAIPRNVMPVGFILALLAVPSVAAFIALRVERELTKVERASQALAIGELSARVDNTRGPSRELASSFNDMAERLEHVIRSREELIQAVSHELGSPLSRLRFHLELLENDAGAVGLPRTEAIRQELDALDELVAELLGYVQSDQRAHEPRLFAPRRILEDLAELARLDQPAANGSEIELAVPRDCELYADPRSFQRAIENLLRNAVRFAESRVRVEVRPGRSQLEVSVEDDGPGIPVEMRAKVLEPFARLDVDRDRKTGGVGLGLAIVTRILHRHRGEIEIGESALGGTRVTTAWPVARRRD